MKVQYRFMRTRGGVTKFARITLVSSPAEEWDLWFGPAAEELGASHEAAVRSGIAAATRRQDSLGGPRHRIEIEALEQTLADASIDAIECAAAIAAWMSFGHDEADVSVVHAADRWQVAFE